MTTWSRPLILIGLLLTVIAIPSLGEEQRSDRRLRRERLDTSEGEFLGDLPEALSSDTVGPRGTRRSLGIVYSPSPQTVTPPGSYALSIDGDFDLGGVVFKGGYPFLHTDGGISAFNTALGVDALVSLTSGVNNTALGREALESNTSGYGNTATGMYSLNMNEGGTNNTAVGVFALYQNVEGFFNTAIGYDALSSNNGNYNTAGGFEALFSNGTGIRNTGFGAYALRGNSAGGYNIALGHNAGQHTEGSSNIFIGNYGIAGSPFDNTLKIGEGTGTTRFKQNRAFISGIRDAPIDLQTKQEVCVDINDQLGPCTPPVSSRRFKEEIRDIGEASARLLALRPVAFRFQEAYALGDQSIQYGLIAEEAAKVLPELVVYDSEGQPQAVKYRFLSSMLLNELQKQHRWNEEQASEIRRLTARLDRLESTEPP